MGFFRQEYWNGLHFSPPGNSPDSGIHPTSPVSLALQADSLPAEPLGKPIVFVVLPLFKVWGPLSLKSTPRIFPLPVPKAQMLMTDWDLWFYASRFSSCLTCSRPRQHSPCLLLPSGRTSFHLWTLSTGTIITTWCRCHPPPELFLENDCWQQVFAALQSHQTVECREKLFARLIFKKKKKKTKKVLPCGLPK